MATPHTRTDPNIRGNGHLQNCNFSGERGDKRGPAYAPLQGAKLSAPLQSEPQQFGKESATTAGVNVTPAHNNAQVGRVPFERNSGPQAQGYSLPPAPPPRTGRVTDSHPRGSALLRGSPRGAHTGTCGTLYTGHGSGPCSGFDRRERSYAPHTPSSPSQETPRRSMGKALQGVSRVGRGGRGDQLTQSITSPRLTGFK